jgi:integrator complex subunit 4
MAAKLKKRALAEYQSQVVEDKERTKRLRLVTKSEPEPDTFLTLDPGECSNREVLRHLVAFNAGLSNQSEESLAAALTKVVELLDKVEDACTRARLVTAWGDLVVLSPDLQDLLLAKLELLDKVTDVTSRDSAAWLAAFITIVKKASLKPCNKLHLFKVGESLLKSSPHPRLHCKALDLLSLLVDSGESEESRDMASRGLKLCGSYSMSQDARVRTAAFHGLLTVHKRGVKLDVSMYPVFCTALTDDYEGVRCEALKLIAALAETEPEYPVEVPGAGEGDTNRLVDDVFSRTCQAISDVRETVRCLAAKIIGGMVGVSKVFLEQTLDKKLMSNMRLKKSAHERMANLVSSGDFSSGKKWADDAPKEKLEADEFSRVAFGSCGAFVHGLKDKCISCQGDQCGVSN